MVGLAVDTREGAAEPPAQIGHCPTTAVEREYETWAGRWVLIGNGEVHLDASGRLGCFYAGGTDVVWASSSPAILASRLAAGGTLTTDRRRLRRDVGISWFPPPRSRFAEVRRLLPSQILDLRTGRVRPRPLMPRIEPGRDFDTTLELIRSNLSTALRRVLETGEPAWLGLTAGFDSRVLLALAHSDGLPVRPFTSVTHETSMADEVLPPVLAFSCGYAHEMLQASRRRLPDRRTIVASHTAGHLSGGDTGKILSGVRDRLEGVSIHGQGFEISSGFWSRLRELDTSIGSPRRTAASVARLFSEPRRSSATAAVCEWLEWCLETPHEHLDWRDRFVLEQRVAGWQSSIEQLHDLGGLERFSAINCARNHALLLGLPEPLRLGSVVQRALIEQVAPHLMAHSFNPADRDFGLARAGIRRLGRDPFLLPRLVSRTALRRWNRLHGAVAAAGAPALSSVNHPPATTRRGRRADG
jgi:hypothetical protein